MRLQIFTYRGYQVRRFDNMPVWGVFSIEKDTGSLQFYIGYFPYDGSEFVPVVFPDDIALSLDVRALVRIRLFVQENFAATVALVNPINN